MTDEERHERRIEQLQGRCVYFNGVQNRVCEAGVVYDELPKPGLPCLRTMMKDDQTCAKREWPTREQAEAEKRESDASLQRILTCMKAITAKHGKSRGLSDSMPCPTGCGGTLRYSIAGQNGHVHGACSTPNCARWMQ